MKKRLLSAILSLCMLLTMVPTVAFAAEDDEAAPQNNSVLKGSCGAEGNEGAMKLARKYGVSKAPTKYKIISADESFHGRTFDTLAATGRLRSAEPRTRACALRRY